jgi:hypothetical protein
VLNILGGIIQNMDPLADVFRSYLLEWSNHMQLAAFDGGVGGCGTDSWNSECRGSNVAFASLCQRITDVMGTRRIESARPEIIPRGEH